MTAEEEEARDRLLFHLENQSGFWFALVVGDDPRPRARLCEAAEVWCKEHERSFVLHEPEPDGLVKVAVALANGDSPGVHWIRADGVKGLIEAWNAAASQMLMAMNERREAYRKRLAGGIIVEGRSALKRILREMAPDLFSIRAFVAEPGEEAQVATGEPREWRPPAALASMISAVQMDPDLALTRLARLTAIEGPATTEKWLDIEDQAMVSLFNTGRYDEAERHARELLSRFEQSADESLDRDGHRRAWAYDLLGRISIFKNVDLPEALRFWARAIETVRLHPTEDENEKFVQALLVIEITKRQAVTLTHLDDLPAAQAALKRHIDMFTIDAADVPPEMQIDLLDSHRRLAEILGQKNEFKPAEDTLKKAAALAGECSSRHPEDPRWQIEVLRCNTALGGIQVMLKDIDAARQTLVSGATIAEGLEGEGAAGEIWREVLDRFYFHLGVVLSCELVYDQSFDRLWDRAVSSIRSWFERGPERTWLGWTLARLYLDRATLLEKDDIAGAKESAEQAQELIARLPVEDDKHAALKRKIEALRAFVGKPRKKGRRAAAAEDSTHDSSGTEAQRLGAPRGDGGHPGSTPTTEQDTRGRQGARRPKRRSP